MLKCYNHGCGKDFDPNKNTDNSCVFHPGVPFFHDAYKGWTCCNKKSVNFTDFLNIKGCKVAKHSNVKPPEPAKPAADTVDDDYSIADESEEPSLQKPAVTSLQQRSDFNSSLIQIEPIIATGLKKSIEDLKKKHLENSDKPIESTDDGQIPIGSVCKNSGCNCSYDPAKLSENNANDANMCTYHSGVPIFHEGLKYWSCCTKRTSDFTAFLNQPGCTVGQHKWQLKDPSESAAIKCRYDWHQTGAQVVIAIYAKMYDYQRSYVKMNPIRLMVSLVFPQEQDDTFNLDLELCGVIDVAKTQVQMLGSKVEITLTKANPGNWSKLDVPRNSITDQTLSSNDQLENVDNNWLQQEEQQQSDSDVDLDDIEPINAVKITEQV